MEKRRGSGGSFDVAISAVEGDCGPKHARSVAANTATGGAETTITTFSFAAGGTSTPTRAKPARAGDCAPKRESATAIATRNDYDSTTAAFSVATGACRPKLSGGCGPS